MSKFLGRHGAYAVFANDTNFVHIDTELNVVVETGVVDEFFSFDDFSQRDEKHPVEVLDLALSALSLLGPEPVLASGRMYTIPAGVQAEAKKSLEWRKKHGRGGTPVGLNTARTLARGGQIGIRKIRHIAKYFPRHEVDKKGKGWSPSEDGFPSNGRIAWALWGGDAGWRWARAIVERDDKQAMKADAYMPSANAELQGFELAQMENESIAPDFLARVRMDGTGIDRVYKIDLDGRVYVWDDGVWDDLGTMDGDIWAYDRALDDPYDNVEVSHIMIDPESAIAICARMQSTPFDSVAVSDLDEEEFMLFAEAEGDEEFEFIDSVITAALPPVGGQAGYTSEERSENVQKQPRDARGLFVTVGKKVVVGNDTQNGRGEIQAINDDGSVKVRLLNGRVVNVNPKLTQTDSSPQTPYAGARSVAVDEPLDVSGILGQPRTPQNMPKAHLPGTLPPITAEDLHNVLYNWDGWVAAQRASFKPDTTPISGKVQATKEERGELPPRAYSNPLLRRWASGERNNIKQVEDALSDSWARPVVSAAEANSEKQVSDVEPMYFAIVSPEDPRAVMDLVSVVPASASSNAPMTYVRKDGKWVREPQFLADLKSATPPPVVPLTGEALNDVLLQVDSLTASGSPAYDHVLMVLWGPNFSTMSAKEEEFLTDSESLFAEGGLDRNRGNAEALRRYWTRGKGAAKIRWGTPGDWRRCVRYLAKYLGPRAKGYCQLRHKEATGVYTGSRLNPGRKRGRFGMEEPMYGFPNVDHIEITDEDMLMPLEDIFAEYDSEYDETWEPEQEVIESLEYLAECSEEEFARCSEFSQEALVAAPFLGGLDRNRGNAERLRHYWTKGKGALKIRWNTGGDWYRCVRYLTKYLGPRAKGYCALRHKEVTGEWTGDRRHLIRYGGKVGRRNVFSSSVINSGEKIFEKSLLIAEANELKNKVHSTLTASADASEVGPAFLIPLVVPEGVESGDGRKFKKNSISWRELPLPLMWQIKTADGHDGSVVVGRIDGLERTEDGIGNAYGVFDSGPHAQEVIRLIKHKFIKGVSADMDKFEATEIEDEDELESAEKGEKAISKSKIAISKARIMGVTIVPKPAFQECQIYLEQPTNLQEEPMISDGIYVEDLDASDAQSLTACGFVAGAIPVSPPDEWFENPKLDRPTPLTVTDEGKVFGHIAAWHVDHIGLTAGTKPPRSKSNYAYFHTGVLRTEGGKDVAVGQLTLAGGHASLEASAYEAVKHYDDTASAIADVHAGEDQFGIWVSGALRPGTTPEQIRILRASAPSGDWRPIRGSLELVAVCQVNVPGFPVARARVASGAVMALVAAGAMTLAKLKNDPMEDITSRLEKLEQSANAKLAQKAQAAREVFASIREEKAKELSSRVAELSSKVDAVFAEEAEDEFAYMPRRERMRLAEEGKAMPDGSFPIRNIEDLKNAIQAHGRAKEAKRAAVKRFIEKRARQLRRPDLIPSEWKEASALEMSTKIESMRSKVAELSASVEMDEEAESYLSEFKQFDPTEREALAKKGQALPDGSYPIRNVSDLKNAIRAYGRSNPEDRAKVRTHIRKRAKALGKENLIPENWYAASNMDGEVFQNEVEEVSPLGKAEAVESEEGGEAPVTVESGLKRDGRYTPKTQPRDAKGKFRQVLARLKQDIGTAGLQNIVEEARSIGELYELGDYVNSAGASVKLLDILDRLDTGALNKVSLENVRASARQLGKVIANLPLGFNDQTEKVRYSDLPPSLQGLMDDMIERVEKKIGEEDADVATAKLKAFKTGSDLFSQGEISAEMSRLLRLLT